MPGIHHGMTRAALLLSPRRVALPLRIEGEGGRAGRLSREGMWRENCLKKKKNAEEISMARKRHLAAATV